MIDRTSFAVLFGLLGLALGLQCPKQTTSPGREVVCYTSAQKIEQLTEAICKCTTLVHQGHQATNVSTSEFRDFQKSLKEINPALQFVISIDDPEKTLITSGGVRQEVTARLIGVLNEVDGVELNVTAGSKERLVHFVKGLKDELLRKSYEKRIFLVLPTKSEDLAKQFDLKQLSKFVDLFAIPTHYLVEDDETHRTFHPSRLMGLFDMFNADSLIDLISGLGAPKRKILISLPASAYRFKLVDKDENTPRAPTEDAQPITIDQKQLCDLMNKEGWTVERDEDLTAPYAFKDDMWIAFEDKISVAIKGKYVLIRDLPGLAVHDVENDLKTDCNKPLTHEIHRSFSSFKRKSRAAVLNALEDELHQTQLDYPTKVKSSNYRVVRVVDTEGHIRAVRENTQIEFTCSRQGYFVHPKSCNRFYRCVKFNQEVEDYSVFEFDCPAGLSFDERTEVCVWPGSMPEGSPCPGSSEIAPVTRIRFECPTKPGYYADPQNPRWFFACIDLGGAELMAYEFRCPFGLIFDEQKLICEWPWLVVGYTGYTSSGYGTGSTVGTGGYGTGSTVGTGGYYTGALPHGYTGTAGKGHSGPAGVGFGGGQGSTGYTQSVIGGYGSSSYSGSGSYGSTLAGGHVGAGSGYTGTVGGGYSGTAGPGRGTQGSTGYLGGAVGGGHGVSDAGGYSGTTASGYSGRGSSYGGQVSGQVSGGYSGTTASGSAGADHGSSYGGQVSSGSSYGGQVSGGYSGTTGSGYSGRGGQVGYSGTTPSGFSGSGVSFDQGTRTTISGYSGSVTGSGRGYSQVGIHGGSTGKPGYSGTGTISYGSTSGVYTGSKDKEYAGATGAGQVSTGYTGTGTIGQSGTPGTYRGTSETGYKGTDQGYSGQDVTGYDSGSTSGGYSGTTGRGYGTLPGGYTGTASGVLGGSTGGGYTGTSGAHVGSTVGGYSGTSGVHIGTTGAGYTGETSGVHVGTTGGGYTGTSGAHAGGYTGTSGVHVGGYTGQTSGGQVGTTSGGYTGTSGAHVGSTVEGYTGDTGGAHAGGYTGTSVHTGGYTGQTGGAHTGYTGTSGVHVGGYTGQTGGAHAGGYTGTSGVHIGSTGAGYTGGTSGVHVGTTAGGYTGTSGAHVGGYTGTSGVHVGQTSGAHVGTTAEGYPGGTSGAHVGTTAEGYPGTSGAHVGYTVGGYTGQTSGVRVETTAGGPTGTSGAHVGSVPVGYSGPGTVYGGPTGTSIAGSTTGAAGGHTISSGVHYAGSTGAGGYTQGTGRDSGIKGAYPGSQYPGSSTPRPSIGVATGHGYPGQTGTSPSGVEGQTGSLLPGQTVKFGTQPSQTPIYASSGITGTGLDSTKVPGTHRQPFGPIIVDKPDQPLCITNCYGSTSGLNATGYTVSPGGLSSLPKSSIPIGYGVRRRPGIVAEQDLQGSVSAGGSSPGSVITYGGTSGTVFAGSSGQAGITTGSGRPGYSKSAPGTPGYVITDGVKTVHPGSASPGATLYGPPSPGVTITGPPTAGTVIKGHSSPGIVSPGQTAPGLSIEQATGYQTGFPTQPGSLSPGSPYGNKVGTVPAPYDTGYKTNEYYDNGGRGTIKFNNGGVTTKYTENDIPDYRPTGGTILPGTFVSGSSTPSGFTKTGFTTASVGGGGSYVIGTGKPRPTPSPDKIGSKAFEGNVVGYTRSSTEISDGGYPGVTSSYDSGVSGPTKTTGYSYVTPGVPFETGVTTQSPISSTIGPTPFLTVEVHNTPGVSDFASITGDGGVYKTSAGFTGAPTVAPGGYTTGFGSSKSPFTVSTPQPGVVTGYGGSSTPATFTQSKYGGQTEAQFGYGTRTSQQRGYTATYQVPSTTPQYYFESTTSPGLPSDTVFGHVTPSGVSESLKPQTQYLPGGQTYQRPGTIESSTIGGGSPTNVEIPRDEVGKLITNYNRGSTKYIPNQYDIYSTGADYSRTQSSTFRPGYVSTTPTSVGRTPSSLTTYSGGYSKPSSIITYQTTAKTTAVGKGKVIVKWSDLHPLLLGKLGAECTCRGDPFANLRGPGSKLINSSKGKVDLANYDESDIYVDLEKEDSSENEEYVTNQESSSVGPVKIWNEELSLSNYQVEEKPSNTYLPSSTVSTSYRAGKSLRNVESSTTSAVIDDEGFSVNRSEDNLEETIDGATNCARPGLFRHPNLCNKFYGCHWDEQKKKFTLHVFSCPVHLTFDNGASACNWPSMGPACQDNNLLV